MVTLDHWAGIGSPSQAVVIYLSLGRVTVDLSFSQVVFRPGAGPACMLMDGPFLSGPYQPKFNAYGGEWFLLLRNACGQAPAINLTTGQFKIRWNGRERDAT